jgi:aldose 1-epimerase
MSRQVITAEGISAAVISYGASLVGLEVEAGGASRDVVVGLPRLADYEDPARNAYQGAMIGRYANRIGGGRIVLDGVAYQLDQNEGTTTLHGGRAGWGRRHWDLVEHGADEVTYRLVSPNGDQGFPGRAVATVTYRVAPRQLRIEATVTVEVPTVVSLTNHTYWNLDGAPTIDDHCLETDAATFLELDARRIPTGATGPVGELGLGGPLRGVELDHYVVAPTSIRLVGAHGLAMEVTTDQPGAQLYTADRLPAGSRRGLCIEPSQWPDAPNLPTAPSPVVRPGEPARWCATYTFS